MWLSYQDTQAIAEPMLYIMAHNIAHYVKENRRRVRHSNPGQKTYTRASQPHNISHNPHTRIAQLSRSAKHLLP